MLPPPPPPPPGPGALSHTISDSLSSTGAVDGGAGGMLAMMNVGAVRDCAGEKASVRTAARLWNFRHGVVDGKRD